MAAYYQRMKRHVQHELEEACDAEMGGRPRVAFSHLERAHILGQRSTRLHVLAHWRMMRWAIRQQQCSEVFGQLLRVVGAVLTTRIGLVPIGNTGGSNVSGFQIMPVPLDLQAIIDAEDAKS